MENSNSLSKMAELAFEILNGNDNNGRTEFSITKGIIGKAFSNETNYNNDIDKIYTRLILIDTLYATQMNKRLYWLEDIANEISKNNDDDLKEMCKKFLRSPKIDDPIVNLLTLNGIGIQKNGDKKGRAISLISKYLYFLMEGKFPIYDDLAKKAYSLISENKEFKNLKIEPFSKPLGIGVMEYFEKIISLNEKSEIKDYTKLDNLLWLVGKIDKGSFSFILEKKKYLNLPLEEIEKEKNTKDQDFNSFIIPYLLKKEKLSDLGKELGKFTSFVLDLKIVPMLVVSVVLAISIAISGSL